MLLSYTAADWSKVHENVEHTYNENFWYLEELPCGY